MGCRFHSISLRVLRFHFDSDSVPLVRSRFTFASISLRHSTRRFRFGVTSIFLGFHFGSLRNRSEFESEIAVNSKVRSMRNRSHIERDTDMNSKCMAPTDKYFPKMRDWKIETVYIYIYIYIHIHTRFAYGTLQWWVVVGGGWVVGCHIGAPMLLHQMTDVFSLNCCHIGKAIKIPCAHYMYRTRLFCKSMGFLVHHRIDTSCVPHANTLPNLNTHSDLERPAP